MLHDSMKELKMISSNHGAIEKVIYETKELLTEEDRNLCLPIAVKRKIKKLIFLTLEGEEPIGPRKWYQFFCKRETHLPLKDYKLRLMMLVMNIVIFIHSYRR